MNQVNGMNELILTPDPATGLSASIAATGLLNRSYHEVRQGLSVGLILGGLLLLFIPDVFAQQAQVPAPGNFPVLTRSYDNSRNAVNLRETQLRPSNVNIRSFGRLFERTVDGQIYAQPLYVPNLEIPNEGKRNVVFIATMHNSVYAFDADDPTESDPLWHVSFIDPAAQVFPVPSADVGQECLVYRDIEYEIGILSTPVIDLVSGTLYVVARTRESHSGVEYVQRLHAIDITSGEERKNSPVEIRAMAPGTGAGSENGIIEFDPLIHNQRTSLLLHEGIVYIAWASHCDTGPYHGWIMGYDAASLDQEIVFVTTPNGVDGGIWQSGEGLSVDAAGDMYVVVGNGTDTAPAGGTGFGNTMLRLRRKDDTLEVVDYFMPFDSEIYNIQDVDLSTGAVLLPGLRQAVMGGKMGKNYLVNLDNMGGFSEGGPDRVGQWWSIQNTRHFTGHVGWRNADGNLWLYSWDSDTRLRAFQYDDTKKSLLLEPVSEGRPEVVPGMPGGVLSLSSNGATDGILWANLPLPDNNLNANWYSVGGVLIAYDANDLSRELWNSQQFVKRDGFGSFAKFVPPVVVNGKVYLATFSGQLIVYGLLPQGGD